MDLLFVFFFLKIVLFNVDAKEQTILKTDTKTFLKKLSLVSVMWNTEYFVKIIENQIEYCEISSNSTFDSSMTRRDQKIEMWYKK